MTGKKMCRIFYLPPGMVFKLSKWVTQQSSPYYQVRQFPIEEMLGSTVEGLVAEVISMTHSTNWRKQKRRPIRRGDICCIASVPYLLVSKPDIQIMRQENLPFTFWKTIPTWSNYSIVVPSKRLLEGKLCVS